MPVQTIGPIISGATLTDAGAGMFPVYNPATGVVIAELACCDTATVDRIVRDSDRAYHDDSWQSLTAADRGLLLYKLADLVEANAEELIELELQDVGKPISQLRGGEIPLLVALIRFYAGGADKIEGSVKTTEGGTFGLTLYEPFGVVAGILPWNYPLVNAGLKVPPALAAGNAIVLKPSVETPLATLRFAELCIEAGIPPGIVNVVTGKGSTAGTELVVHPLVKKVSFTGSTAVGQIIQKLATDQLKTVNLECGGKNAIIVCEDADLERAAQATLLSAFVNNGQLCVACSRLLVHASIAKTFTAMLVEKAQKIITGNPRDEATMVGPMITKGQHQTVLKYLSQVADDGCTVATGGKPLTLDGDEFADGLWIEPTILTHVKPGMSVHDEEIFGPVLTVTTFETDQEAVELANTVEYGLSGSVWTADGARSLRFIKALDTGIIWVNTMLTGYPQICLSPHKLSGTGVELGMEGMLAYCKRKSAMIGYDNAPVGWGL